MALPFFYTAPIKDTTALISLSEENAKHIVQVLRMTATEKIKLTDGLGNIYKAEIIEAHKKNCTVKILSHEQVEKTKHEISIAISPLKNSSRLEWFIEKATEIGITEIIPIICSRTEKQFLKQERLQSILVSAMLQSQQAWLPVLQSPIKIHQLLQSHQAQNKFIAHCEEGIKVTLNEALQKNVLSSSILLIGPEGDFTINEIDAALAQNFIAVSLGDTRLRTETAAILGAITLRFQKK
jgi:16S rRNA (uracil1498-N3)-methyltransferase